MNSVILMMRYFGINFDLAFFNFFYFIREAVVNAIGHRDQTITLTDIELSIYSDRLEVISPGRLPNTVTVAKMKAGYRATRNELIKEILRDYR